MRSRIDAPPDEPGGDADRGIQDGPYRSEQPVGRRSGRADQARIPAADAACSNGAIGDPDERAQPDKADQGQEAAAPGAAEWGLGGLEGLELRLVDVFGVRRGGLQPVGRLRREGKKRVALRHWCTVGLGSCGDLA